VVRLLAACNAALLIRGPIAYDVAVGPGSAEQRVRTMLRIAGRTLHRVRDRKPPSAGRAALESAAISNGRRLLDQQRVLGYDPIMKTQTIEIDDDTATALKQRAQERGVTVPELVAELVTLAAGPVDADADDVAELDRRWNAFEAQGSVATNEDVVRWLQTWGTSTFRSWHKR
jgi:predicted transcriptional regulator